MQTHRVIGVLGGMGPAATVEFFRRLVAATPATIDQDHLRIVIDDDPTIPDRTRALLHGGPSPVPALSRVARRLEVAGAEILAMPCNTAHAFLGAIREAVDAQVLDMIEETAAQTDAESVGLLATAGTIEARIYHRVFDARGIGLVVPEPDDQQTVGRAIEAVKASRSLVEVEAALVGVVERLEKRGASAVVAGCTEISLLNGTGMPLRWIDALDCLVEATIREALRDSVDP
jgi:aspartate racemase